jgi:hypothetical protein
VDCRLFTMDLLPPAPGECLLRRSSLPLSNYSQLPLQVQNGEHLRLLHYQPFVFLDTVF